MNIKEAKTEIKNTLLAYHRRDKGGNYIYPALRQRPILLMGPPGIGKTAILEQVASECGVGLVAYTMTHHTRQSSIGLPHIESKIYGGREVSVTEYTMSEIIASVYDCMERTGKTEGILFLDEINCVSETLAPTMLQLLQNKTFGNHKIPEGWLIVTAGNPPEYNKSVREFDVATLDRVRSIPVEPDCGVWMEYANEKHVHPAILSYLAIKPRHFYIVEDTTEGKNFVTARGWEDLSEMLKACEDLDVPVTAALVSQFLQKSEVAKAFAAYYLLYKKYDSDYGIAAMLGGAEDSYAQKVKMAQKGGFEERFTVIHLLLDALDSLFCEYELCYGQISGLHSALEYLRDRQLNPDEYIAELKKSRDAKVNAGLMETEEQHMQQLLIEKLAEYSLAVKQEHIWDAAAAFEHIKQLFAAETAALDELTSRVAHSLERAFDFAGDCFGDGQEMHLLVSHMAKNRRIMTFIAQNGSESFLKYSNALLFRQQESALQEECRRLLQL